MPDNYDDKVLRKIEDYQNQNYKSRHFSGLDSGVTDFSMNTSPSRVPLTMSNIDMNLRDAAKENSKDKKLTISVSQNLLSD